MESPTVMFSRLAVHQDFVWFFSLLGWSFALILWRRHPQRGSAWPWLPWAAAAAIATALVQFGMFSPTFDLFQARLVPGTVAIYRPARIDPYWLGDVVIGFAEAAMAAGWLWQGLRRPGAAARVGAGVLLAALAVWRALVPAPAGGWLPAAALLGAAALWPGLRTARASRAGLLLAAAMPWLSTIGPVAGWLGMLQRAGPPQPAGLVAGGAQLIAGSLILLALAREGRAALAPAARAQLARDARPYLPVGLAVLGFGIAVGVQTGRDNRHEIQQNRLRQTAGQALVFDGALLAPLRSPEFRLERVAGAAADGDTRTEFSRFVADGALRGAERRLAEVALTSPFLHAARIVVIHDGWLVAVASTRPPGPPGTVELLRRATADDLARWAAAQPHVEEPPVPEIGRLYYTRAPILGPDGRLAGWLDGVREEYVLSVERRWRAAPFVVTALALVILAQMLSQQWSARLREAALRDAAVAAESSRVKTAFLAKVSHELRTPLQSILGYSELLQQAPRGEPDRGRLAALRQHGELMLRLVNDLLDLSAVEAGAFRLIERPVPLAELVRQTVESLRPRAQAKGLALDFRADGRVPGWVMADAERLRQLLLNLLGNALKFTAHGRIDVVLESGGTAPGGGAWVDLAVSDTGPGIAAGDQRRIFEPFQRLDPAAPHEGAGLGLALVAALCRSMGGEITVESDGRSGTTFRARLALRPAASSPSGRPEAPVALAGRKILVADDNPLVRELFRSYLGGLGAACVVAADGGEALARAPGCDAVVLDLAMPGRGGLDVARSLRTAGLTMRIVGVSAHAGAVERERARAAGMDAFLAKPVELADLAAALEPAAGAGGGDWGDEPALRARLAKHFRAEAGAQGEAVARALEREDWPGVAAAAHYLKSSAAVVRDDRLYRACGRLQAAAEAGGGPEAAAAWQECRAALAGWIASSA